MNEGTRQLIESKFRQIEDGVWAWRVMRMTDPGERRDAVVVFRELDDGAFEAFVPNEDHPMRAGEEIRVPATNEGIRFVTAEARDLIALGYNDIAISQCKLYGHDSFMPFCEMRHNEPVYRIGGHSTDGYRMIAAPEKSYANEYAEWRDERCDELLELSGATTMKP